ncbi:MAG: N(4)-(beta-N-acetylglucosaminyl)-L-asparaginase [Bryobacterales bacterium]|nr:N(4)-(beta-N-acetylglucosaminyl)-L-asparaginase [Bryobacterales bacterium]
MLRRRDFVPLAPAAAAAFAQARPEQAGNVVIASSNGLAAVSRAMELLAAGADTLDAAIAGVNINEEDPEDNSVGYGGLPNEDGVVELDASVMHGPTRRAGAVASLRNIKTPSKVARLVMERTDHIMLVGEGALRFAKAMGFREENLLTEKARLAWLVWKQSLRDPSGGSNWSDGLDAPPAQPDAALRRQFPDAAPADLAWAREVASRPPTGTINCLALNAKGEISGVTTTSGLAWKIAGRVGDSPIIGAGLFVDQDVGAAGSTGRGEENIRVAGAHTAVENMRHGMGPREACLDVLQRIARNFGNDRRRLERFDILFYALRRDGQYAAAALWNRAAGAAAGRARQFAVSTRSGSRLEECAWLLER